MSFRLKIREWMNVFLDAPIRELPSHAKWLWEIERLRRKTKRESSELGPRSQRNNDVPWEDRISIVAKHARESSICRMILREQDDTETKRDRVNDHADSCRICYYLLQRRAVVETILENDLRWQTRTGKAESRARENLAKLRSENKKILDLAYPGACEADMN